MIFYYIISCHYPDVEPFCRPFLIRYELIGFSKTKSFPIHFLFRRNSLNDHGYIHMTVNTSSFKEPKNFDFCPLWSTQVTVHRHNKSWPIRGDGPLQMTRTIYKWRPFTCDNPCDNPSAITSATHHRCRPIIGGGPSQFTFAGPSLMTAHSCALRSSRKFIKCNPKVGQVKYNNISTCELWFVKDKMFYLYFHAYKIKKSLSFQYYITSQFKCHLKSR